ncbi:MAG: adenylyl-sulfate kinase [Thermodesulfobacteriota bacterium]|nr:adenylyl-sulfate kinase [Thermodesulfobacteriota bacterium]
MKKNNVTWFNGYVSREDRERLHNHKGAVIWFTGLSASGKSTIAHLVEKKLHERGCSTYVFDGDNVRHGLCSDLGFKHEDRAENIRRIGEMVKLFANTAIISLTAFISPYREDRTKVRNLLKPEEFFEVYVNCPLEVCASRDPKGIYQKAKDGLIKDFTGVTAPYEPPKDPEMVLYSDREDATESAMRVVHLLEQFKIIPKV